MLTQVHQLLDAIERDHSARQRFITLLAHHQQQPATHGDAMRAKGFITYADAAERLATTETAIAKAVDRGRYHGQQQWVHWGSVVDFITTYGRTKSREALRAYHEGQRAATAPLPAGQAGALSVAHRSTEEHRPDDHVALLRIA